MQLFIHDMYAGGNPNFKRIETKSKHRGYEKIDTKNTSIKHVQAIALVDKLHSRVAEQATEIFKLLNNNKWLIKYDYLKYEPKDLK